MYESPKPFFHDTWNFVEVPKEEDRTVEAEIELPNTSNFEISVHDDVLPQAPQKKIIVRQNVDQQGNGMGFG